ncbi:MAG: glutathione S-transferase [Proteobacteria bacterium]|nr:glutathione S-transferase [Pseudomonadota bacterium]
MSDIAPLTLIGSPPSPYTRKMISLLRYRQIPYKVIWGDPQELLTNGGLSHLNIEPPKPNLLPTFIIPDQTGKLKAFTDSTPLLRRFENEFEKRKCVPQDKFLSFINYVLEDFADEWATKYMFHFRWHFDEDIDNAGTLLPLNQKVNLDDESLASFKKYIAERQVSRLGVVGSNETSAKTIEKSYKRFLNLLEKHFKNFSFLLGERPASSDFSLFGQLSQLIGFDPTSRKIAHEISPRTVAWVSLMEDLSGLEVSDEDWIQHELPESVENIFKEIGNVYLPALLANENAFKREEKTWEVIIDDSNWSQNTFPYQVKCLNWINDEFQNLNDEEKNRTFNFLEKTGCAELVRK